MIHYLLIICLLLASLIFNNLPFSGNTPNVSLPFLIADKPLIAIVFAESPSVKIKLQSADLDVPA